MRISLRSPAAALLLASLFSVACSDKSTSPPQPATVAAVVSTIAPAPVGATLTSPITVVVRDAGGTALSGIAVTFAVTQGGGSVAPATVTTGNSGEASTAWTLGTTPGAQAVQASVSGVTGGATFTTTARAGDPRSIAIQAGNAQNASAGAVVTVAPAVLLLDQFGNPVPGVSVFYTVTTGGGSVTGSGAISNAAGIATVGSWRLGSALGTNRLTALAVFNGVTGNPIEFTATAVAGAASRIAAVSAATVAGIVGATVTPAPSVRVTDASGNPVAGVQITFTGSAGSSVTGGVKATDSTGVATVDGWVLGTIARAYTLSAVAQGVSTGALFTATAAPGVATTVAVAAGAGQSAPVGRPVAIEPSVRVVDDFGNPIAGIEVVFSVTNGGGFALGRTQNTNSSGVATVGGWTLGEAPGLNTLRATVTGGNISGNPITFSATATPGSPTSMVVLAGNGQTASAGRAVATAPAVAVRDNRGNPVAGVVVQFIVSSGGGALVGADALTNASGVATVGSWTLGAVAGPQTLIARLIGVPDLTFTATAQAGSASQVQAVSNTAIGNVVVNTLVSIRPSVRVRDSLGNPVAGAEVRFEVSPVDTTGALTGAIQLTDSAGIATLGSWRVGKLANSVTSVKAFVTGLDLAGTEPTFTATKVAGAAAALAPAPGSDQVQAGVAGAAVASIPAVRVTDAFGNSVAGASVVFVAAGGNGVVVGSPAVSDANGLARITSWTLPAGSGARTITASITGTAIPVVVFTANVP